MGRSVLQLKGYKPKDIKALINQNKEYKIGIKLHAVCQVFLGKPGPLLRDWIKSEFKVAYKKRRYTASPNLWDCPIKRER